MTCGSKCTCKKEEWNNGTIYRIFVKVGDTVDDKDVTSNIIDVPVDIAQSELTGKVFIGVENYCLDRRIITPEQAAGRPLTNFNEQDDTLIEQWATVQYLQLQSINLPPDIDFTAVEKSQTGQNTQIFARIPLQTTYGRITANSFYMAPRSAETFPLTKDGILYEMTNNPHALSNGRLRIQLLDDDGPWNLTRYPIYNLAFTIVIYKPRNTYN